MQDAYVFCKNTVIGGSTGPTFLFYQYFYWRVEVRYLYFNYRLLILFIFYHIYSLL